ncbi:MAG: YbgA family protein [Thiotrichales bacterium]
MYKLTSGYINLTRHAMRPIPSLTAPAAPPKPLLGISSCLIGAEVRFDGQHKRDAYIASTLSQFFDFVPICPEVAIGLGIPRQPIRLVRIGEAVRVRGVRTPELDVGDALRDYAVSMAARLTDLSGYIVKARSPSCGMERLKVYDEHGRPLKSTGSGFYTQAFRAHQPLLPVEEEGRLGDPALRENFIERVFVYHRWRELLATGITPARLVEFHTRHKLMLLAHNQAAYRRLGRLVAQAGSQPLAALAETYALALMTALARIATPRQHVNVLQHLTGYLRDHLDRDDRAELLESIADHGRGLLPLIVPITLLKHHFRRHPHPYVAGQWYLAPYPAELMLRNRV